MEAEKAAKHPIAPTMTNFIIASIAPLVEDAKNGRLSQRSSSMNATGITRRVICIIFTHTMRGSGAENLTITNFIIIASISPLANNTINRRPLQRISSTNASGITQRVVCIFFTHTMHGSGAENLQA
jgi:hypothetical protein